MYKKISFYSRPYPRIDSYRKMIDLAAEYGMTGLEGYCQYEFETPDIEVAREMRAYASRRASSSAVFQSF